ncbi:radical SAM family heme chaperone HemW [Bacillus fonticola]|uniref:radical SAM family heme chaperone HemW n=1 Tax=Bacillus fonticola TaxID=2728853 RepID=UPI0014762B1A|nr:radical SAM family heme chaperone HemW [Bacillus fonticola]
MIRAAYVHIPFCETICYYCDFPKVFAKGQPLEAYVDALLKEVEETVRVTPSDRLDTLFIGGGTPTVLSSELLRKLCEGLKKFLPLAQDAEWTIEANPEDVSQEKLDVLKAVGVNRLSFGVQSFDPDVLQAIGRAHTPEKAISTIKKAQATGFENISVDIMFALPKQTQDSFVHSMETVVGLEIQHVSSYALILEEKTQFANWVRSGRLELPSEDTEANQYEMLLKFMSECGYNPYEISNFARPGFQSRHNLTYWNNESYYGFGAGAHGYVEGIRTQNIAVPSHYIESMMSGKGPYLRTSTVTRGEQMEEELFLGLRKVEGVSIQRFQEKFGVSLRTVYGKVIENLKEKGWVETSHTHLRLTKEGMFLGNEVFQSFLVDSFDKK